MLFKHAFNLEPSTNYRSALVETKSFLAFQKQHEGKNEEAAKLFREVLALDDHNALYWLQLALSYQQLGKLEPAKQALERAISIDPQYAVLRNHFEDMQADKKR